MAKMLQKNPKERIDIKELLNHELFKIFMDDILSSLNTFKSSVFGPHHQKLIENSYDSSVIDSEVNVDASHN